MQKIALILAIFVVLLGYARADEKTIIDRVNAANKQISSLTANVENITRRRAVAMTAEGKLYFQKPMNFRLQTTNVRQQQASADIGSNREYFWFWIRKLNPQTVYFSKYSNLLKTNLPDSLHPLWMMDLLGINSVETKNAKLSTQSGYIVVQEVKTNPQQKQIIKVTLLDPNRPAIVGHRVYSATGQLLAASTTTNFYKINTGAFLPQQTETRWYTEQISITTTYREPQINVRIDGKTFEMPKFNLPTIDIGKQRVDFEIER